MIEEGKETPIHMLISFLCALPGYDFFPQAPEILTKEQKQSLSEHFQDIEQIQIFYHK